MIDFRMLALLITWSGKIFKGLVGARRYSTLTTTQFSSFETFSKDWSTDYTKVWTKVYQKDYETTYTKIWTKAYGADYSKDWVKAYADEYEQQWHKNWGKVYTKISTKT